MIFPEENEYVCLGAYLSKEGGVSIMNEGNLIQTLYMQDGLKHSHVTSILKDANNKIWIGTGFMDEGGISVFIKKENNWQFEEELIKTDGLAGEKVRSLFQDSNKMIWIGSEYDGVTLFAYETDIKDGVILDILTTENGLTNNEVKSMAEGDEGNLW